MRTSRLLLVVLTSVLAAACGPAKEPPPPADPSVSSEVLAIRLASLPADFEVAVNDSRGLELVPAEAKVGGRIVFAVGDEEPEVNLVAAVHRHQSQVEGMPGAEYKGGQELLTPHGKAFYSRGRFLAGTDLVEETVVVLQHPASSRLLTISYRYPAAGDSSVRVQQLLELLGELEGTAGTATAGSE